MSSSTSEKIHFFIFPRTRRFILMLLNADKYICWLLYIKLRLEIYQKVNIIITKISLHATFCSYCYSHYILIIYVIKVT